MTYSVHGHVILTCLTLAEDYLHEKKGGGGNVYDITYTDRYFSIP